MRPRLTCYMPPDMDEGERDALATLAGRIADRALAGQALEVEEALLAGAEEITVEYLPGTNDSRRVVYTAPTWRRSPIRRLRFLHRRRLYRKGKR